MQQQKLRIATDVAFLSYRRNTKYSHINTQHKRARHYSILLYVKHIIKWSTLIFTSIDALSKHTDFMSSICLNALVGAA